MGDPKKLSGDEYLERYGVAAHMREVTQLLLEYRPEMPVEFVAEYYRHAARGSIPLMRSYQQMRRTQQSRAEFIELLVSAYASMEAKGGVTHQSDRRCGRDPAS